MLVPSPRATQGKTIKTLLFPQNANGKRQNLLEETRCVWGAFIITRSPEGAACPCSHFHFPRPGYEVRAPPTPFRTWILWTDIDMWPFVLFLVPNFLQESSHLCPKKLLLCCVFFFVFIYLLSTGDKSAHVLFMWNVLILSSFMKVSLLDIEV